MKNPKNSSSIHVPDFPSMAAMASQTGIPIDLLKKAKRDGCPFVHNSSRCDLTVFLKWYFGKGTDVADDGAEMDWATRDKRAVALIRECKLERERGLVIARADVERFNRHLVAVLFFGELDRLAQEFPVTLKAKDEIAIHEEVLKQIENVKKNLTAALDSTASSCSSKSV